MFFGKNKIKPLSIETKHTHNANYGNVKILAPAGRIGSRKARACPAALRAPKIWGKTMTRAIKIEDIKGIDDTAAQILRVIALHLGERDAARVNYEVIAKSLNISRNAVGSAVRRMVRKGFLKVDDGKISIPKAVKI